MLGAGRAGGGGGDRRRGHLPPACETSESAFLAAALA